MIVALVHDLFVILAAGLISGVVAKRLGSSMLVGYLLAGAVIGQGGLGLIGGTEGVEEIEYLARAGALLLLFAIGTEFSLEELLRLSRYFVVGGSLQMVLVAVPVAVTCMTCTLLDLSWQTSLLIAMATALSSTVLVFRALAEWGETASPPGRRAIGILLFQDVALVPLMLLIPLLTEGGGQRSGWAYLQLAFNSVLFVSAVLVLRKVFASWVLLLGALAAAFGYNFAEMWLRWFPNWRNTRASLYDRIVGGEGYYTHGPLVPLVSLLILVLLVRHTKVPVRPSRRTGGVVLSLSILLHLVSSLARVNFVSGFAFIGVLTGLVLMLWGWRALRRLWFPIAFLVFMVPLPEISIAQLNFRLKMLASDWGVALANLFGVIVERSGNQVFLEGDKTMVIANVCNGLRTLISVMAFGALYAYVCRLRGGWRLFLFAMSVPIAVVS